MTNRHPAHVDRGVRLELLRARAAVEREALSAHFGQVGRSLGPLAVLGGLSKMPASSMLTQGMVLLRQYPFLLSSLSALFAAGRRKRVLKIGALGMVAWQGLRWWLGRRAQPGAAAGARQSQSRY